MKKTKTTRFLSGLLALVMVLLVLPVFPLTVMAETETSELPKMDYSPFLIESVDGKAVYNAQTADMTYSFYNDAESYVDNNGKDYVIALENGKFSFDYDDATYCMTDVYIHKPGVNWTLEALIKSTSGMLIGMLNYVDADGANNSVMLIAFTGTDKSSFADVTTNLSCAAQKVGEKHYYHNGFHEAAKAHYNSMKSMSFVLGTGKRVTFEEYLSLMRQENSHCQMIVSGHSLGAAVANIFTSYYMDYIEQIESNVVAYTYATPLTCSDGTVSRAQVSNVFNFINIKDWVPYVGYGMIGGSDIIEDFQDILLGGKGKGACQGVDFFHDVGGKKALPLNMAQHKMWDSVYGRVLNYANENVYNKRINPLGSFVVYDNYDPATHTHQRIIYNDGELIVSGNGVLNGDWSEHTLVDWAKVKDSCTSLTFAPDCGITEIGDYAFAGMAQLKNELRLPESVTKIGNYAFFHCGFTDDLIIPAGMKEVGISAFNGCFELDSINALGAEDMTWGYGAFANCVYDEADLKLPNYSGSGNLGLMFAQYIVQDFEGRVNIEHYFCHKCGKLFEDQYGLACVELQDVEIPAIGHKYTSVVTEPTCTKQGYTSRICSQCDDIYIDSEVDTLGHDYVAEVVDPTCTEQGYTAHTCSRCDDTYTDGEVDALGHRPGEWIVDQEPAPGVEGSKHIGCTICGETLETEVIEALPVDTESETETSTETQAPMESEIPTESDSKQEDPKASNGCFGMVRKDVFCLIILMSVACLLFMKRREESC